MPSNIIPDQSANIDQMLDDNYLHGQLAGGSPYIKELYENIINYVNTLASESNTTPGSSKIGIKAVGFTNFTPATNDVAAALVAIDTVLAGGAEKDKYLMNIGTIYAPFWGASQAIVSKNAVIEKIQAWLGIDAGDQKDSMENAADWSGTTDIANVAVDNDVFKEGSGSMSFDKTGTTVLIGGITRTNIPDFDASSKFVRAWVYVPAIASGNFAGIRFYIASLNGLINFKYWNLTTDVAGVTITPGQWWLVEIEASSSPDGFGGGIDLTNIDTVSIQIEVNSTAATFAGARIDHLIVLPGSTTLDVDVYKNGILIKKAVDTFTFEDIRAGNIIEITGTDLADDTLTEDDILEIAIRDTGNYVGKNLSIFVKT